MAQLQIDGWPADEGHLPIFLTPLQYSQLRGVSLRTIDRERADGTGAPFCKIGRRIAYRRAAVLSWMELQEVTSSAEARRLERERKGVAR